MRNKEYLTELFERSKLHINNLKIIIVIPILLIDIVFPYMVYKAYLLNMPDGYEYFLDYILDAAMELLPIASIILCVFSMKDYVGETGVEILYVSRSKVKLPDFFLLVLYPLIDIIVVGVFVCWVAPDAVLIFLAVICIAVFMFGLAYFLLYYTKSLTAVILAELLYIFLSILISNVSFYEVFPFYGFRFVSVYEFSIFYIPLFIDGILLSILGVRKNKLQCI